MLNIRQARETAGEELATRLQMALALPAEESRSDWFAAIPPSRLEERSKFAHATARFIAEFRKQYSWGQNQALADQEYEGDLSKLQQNLAQRFTELTPLEQELCGLGSTALAYGVLVRSAELASQRHPANHMLSSNDISDLAKNLQMVDGFITVAVDVSSRFAAIPRIGDMHRALKYAAGHHVYYTIGGGLEAGWDIDQQSYSGFLAQGLGIVSTTATLDGLPKRQLTCYLGNETVDSRMYVGIEAAGYQKHELGDSVNDDTFGTVQRVVLAAT